MEINEQLHEEQCITNTKESHRKGTEQRYWCIKWLQFSSQLCGTCAQVLHLSTLASQPVAEMGALGDMRQFANQAEWSFLFLAENNWGKISSFKLQAFDWTTPVEAPVQ